MNAPSDILLNVLASFLIPLLHAPQPATTNPATTNPGNARNAAREILAACRCRDPWELLLGVQAASATMAALGSMALSMTAGLSLSMTLRLRGNANACTRSAETSRRALLAARAETDAEALQAAEQARDAAFHARYTDEQARADIAETTRMAEAAAEKQQNRKANAELEAAWEELKDSCDRRIAAEQAEAARTGIPLVVAPLAPLDPAIERISLEDFLNAPPGFSLIDHSRGPRQAAPAETATPAAEPAAHAQPAAPAEPAASPAEPAPAQPATTQSPPPPAQPAKPHPAGPQPAIHHPRNDDEARRAAWANAMLQVATEFTDALPNASPGESRLNKIRANALSSVARTLLSAAQPATEPHFNRPPGRQAPPTGKPWKT